jgi:type IV pilus assembly protein PilV
MKNFNTTPFNDARGFTLIEVMVALIIIAVGMLGIAKMQGLALSSTNASRSRALASIEASSLASAMQANRVYWSNAASLPGTITVTTSAGTATAAVTGATGSAALQTAYTAAAAAACGSMGTNAPSCFCTTGQSAPCTSSVNMAGSDLYDWAQSLAGFLPNATAQVSCNSADLPVDCTINISWSENTVALTTQQATQSASGSTVAVSYNLYVVP